MSQIAHPELAEPDLVVRDRLAEPPTGNRPLRDQFSSLSELVHAVLSRQFLLAAADRLAQRMTEWDDAFRLDNATDENG